MKGHLVIAGGNIRNSEIYKRFVRLAGNGKIAIVPTATDDIIGTLKDYTQVFKDCGIQDKNIVTVKLHPDYEKNDEWKRNGDAFEDLDFLTGVKGIWFTGGDQIRIIKSFLRSDGTDTRLLGKFREILEAGGVIGGSSAGAAIMSEIMIGGGTSFGSMSKSSCRDFNIYRRRPELENNGVLLITKGLGFVKNCIVDQHFDKRSRLGRLLEAMFSENTNQGYGIAEDTAAIFDLFKGSIEIVGSGGVTIIDTSMGERFKIENYSKIKNVKISFLEDGDGYNIKQNSYYIKTGDELKDNELYAHKKYISDLFLIPEIDFRSFKDSRLAERKREAIFYSNENKMQFIRKCQFGDDEAGYEIRLYNSEGYKETLHQIRNSFIEATIDILPIFNKSKELKEAVE